MPSLSAKILALSVLTFALALSDGAAPVAAQGTGSISGRVINDLNGNGAADPGEPGVEGWRVVLSKLGSVGRPWVDIAETRTGPGGDYHFSGLAPEKYEVRLPCDGQRRRI